MKEKKFNIIDELANIENNKSKSPLEESSQKNDNSNSDHDWSNILGAQVDTDREEA